MLHFNCYFCHTSPADGMAAKDAPMWSPGGKQDVRQCCWAINHLLVNVYQQSNFGTPAKNDIPRAFINASENGISFCPALKQTKMWQATVFSPFFGYHIRLLG